MAGRLGVTRLILFVILLAGSAPAQNRISLNEAGVRKEETFAPLHEGDLILVHGVAANQAIRILDYSHLAIHNDRQQGLTVEGPFETLKSIRAGDVVEVEGKLANRAGLPVLQPTRIEVKGTTAPPEAVSSTVNELNSFARLGALVQVESRVLATNLNSAGETILLGGFRELPLRVFYPAASRAAGGELDIRPGDHVVVTGLSSQYAPNAPHDDGFQMVIGSAAAIRASTSIWTPSPDLLFFGLLTIFTTLGIWWVRERAMAAQRKNLRGMTLLAEELISASSPAEISQKLTPELPRILRASSAEMYLFNRHTDSLDRVPTPAEPEPLSASVQHPIGRLASGVSLCFRNRAMLHIPDTNRSPLLTGADDDDLPRSVLFVPMFAQQELLGVLAIGYKLSRARVNPDEQAATQHLANQAATSLKLQEQHSVREQLMRSEKMAAAGQMISGVVTELRGPLEAIEKTAGSVLSQRIDPVLEAPLKEVLLQASRGSGIVNRLVSFAKAEPNEAKPLNIHAVVSSLIEFREPVCRQKSVQVRNTFPNAAAMVLGDQGQLEQTILNLLVHAEQSLVDSKEKCITVGSAVLGKRISISIDYTDRTLSTPGTETFNTNGHGEALGLQVCQALIASHGGELRLLRNLPSGARFEIELPLHQRAAVQPSAPGLSNKPVVPLTVLIVEPDSVAQRKLVTLLSARAHRVVPVISAEHATEMVHRLRFDVTFCSVRLPGLNWVEFYERIRRRIGAFVLLAEGYDSELLQTFRGGEGFILSKPIDEQESEQLLAKIEARQETAARR